MPMIECGIETMDPTRDRGSEKASKPSSICNTEDKLTPLNYALCSDADMAKEVRIFQSSQHSNVNQ